MNKELLKEILDTIRESIGYKVEQIEGLTQSLRIIHKQEVDLKAYGNEIAIQAIIDSIEDAANDMLFGNLWDADWQFQCIKAHNNLKSESQDDISELTIGKDGITKAE